MGGGCIMGGGIAVGGITGNGKGSPARDGAGGDNGAPATNGVPQETQNLAMAWLTVPHFGQTICDGVVDICDSDYDYPVADVSNKSKKWSRAITDSITADSSICKRAPRWDLDRYLRPDPSP